LAHHFALLSVGALSFSCSGRSTCEVAQDRLNECNDEIKAAASVQGFVRLPLALPNCSGQVNECVASCVADSNCPAITYVLLGKQNDPNEPIPPGADKFAGCINGCTKL
jgi:hypothetical protein